MTSDRLEHVPCNLCGSTEYTIRFPSTRPAFSTEEEWAAFRCTHPGYGIHGQIVTCDHCGMVYTNPRRPPQQISTNYATVEDPLYLRERRAREVTFTGHLRNFERYCGPGQGRRILDIGAYIGVFVEVAQQAGWEAWGLEPSAWAVKYARERGLNVLPGGLPEGAEQFEPGSFDAVTQWDVIEHFTDPMGALRASYDLLRPGGWIAVHTMDIDSLLSRLMGPRWPWLMEMHIYYFSRRTLAEMLRRAGFEVARVRPEGRHLRLKYLITRLAPYSQLLAATIERIAGVTGLDKALVPVNFGDLVTAYARKPE
ncbi:MAG: hypothetical protein Kow00124_18630 [Anaerolineae bacterium]